MTTWKLSRHWPWLVASAEETGAPQSVHLKLVVEGGLGQFLERLGHSCENRNREYKQQRWDQDWGHARDRCRRPDSRWLDHTETHTLGCRSLLRCIDPNTVSHLVFAL